MSFGIVGKKVGMTRLFEADGNHISVTVIEAKPNRITQVKTAEKDGYYAVQVTYDEKKLSRVSKPLKGHYAKNGVIPGRGLCEFRVDSEEELADLTELTIQAFADIRFVDVTGVSKGKGFQGGVKRHNFCTQDATHGNSLSHRAIGSTGQNQSPGKVFKGKKMPGQMGNKKCTSVNLKLVRVDTERHLLLVQGAVPGHTGSYVTVYPAVKRS